MNLTPLRIEGGGARHFIESLLLELTMPPFSSRYVMLLMCIPEMRAHLEELFKDAPNAAVVPVRSDMDIVHCQQLFDLYFSPLNALSPLLPDRPTVACLMDIQEKFYPQFFSEGQLAARQTGYHQIVHRATLACTISDFCRQTFVDKMEADPERLRVVHLYPQKRVLDAVPQPVPDCPESFMLYPANWYEHKNHRNLVLGYVRALQQQPNLPSLVLVGHQMDNGEWLKQLCRSHDPAPDIRVYTEISPSQLRSLYERCCFVVLPTLFEGYCMPLAEAIVLGRPVLANDLPVMREIGGNWPSYAALNEPDQIAAAILSMNAPQESSPEKTLPPALATWSWREIALAYETIFHQAMMKHRMDQPRS